MKKTAVTLLAMMFGVFLFSLSAQSQLEDKIELSREGGTTRIASAGRMNTMLANQVVPEVEAYSSQNAVTISVQNYRGNALVEIIGGRGGKQAFFQVYDMGFEVVDLSGLRAGEYTIRVTMGSEVFTGKFKKGMYGR